MHIVIERAFLWWHANYEILAAHLAGMPEPDPEQ